MAFTLRQIQYGEPEGKAIDAFGRRCNLQPYMKLSSLLEQNRRTGTKNLQQLLEQEMTAAWEEQKHTARRLGEEAGTRLLIPLFFDAGSGDGDHHGPGAAGSAVEGNRSDGSARLPR